MKGIKSIAWWKWLLFAGLPIAAAAYLAFSASLVTLIVVVSGMAPSIISVWGPREPRPQPHLLLRPNGRPPESNIQLGNQWRPLDVDAVIKSAEQFTRKPNLNAYRFLVNWAAKPTDEDMKTYQGEVDRYLVEMRTWAESAEAWLATNASALECHVFQENESDVDAEDAKVTITFPEGTEQCDTEDLERPEEPELPKIKTRPGPLAQAFRPWAGAASSPYDSGPALNFSMTDVERHSIDEPDFNKSPDGNLEVTFRRQPIRHREHLPSGDPFTVRLPPGQHEITWRVTAKNLPHPKTGTWVVSCPVEAVGDPIRSLGSLQAALAGEPELDVKALFASKRPDPDTGEGTEA